MYCLFTASFNSTFSAVCENEKMSNLIDDFKINEIIQRSKLSPTFAGSLKRLTRERKWTDRYCLLYQNFLVEFEDQCCVKVTCLIPLENYQAKRMEINNIDDIYKQVFFCNFFHYFYCQNYFQRDYI